MHGAIEGGRLWVAAGSGSYPITFESTKRYHGKGGEDGARASAKRVGAESQDSATQVDWKPAKNAREGFKAEARTSYSSRRRRGQPSAITARSTRRARRC
jgi:hypothetical protein